MLTSKDAPALLLALILVSLSVSGCVAGALSTESLTVPPTLDGERAVYVHTFSGHRQEWHTEGAIAVSDQHEETRTVSSSRTITDPWLRPVRVVEIRSETKDLDPEADEMKEFMATELFETASGFLVARELSARTYAPASECSLTECPATRNMENVIGISFPRHRPEAEWASLAGRTLHVGERLTFERTDVLDDLGWQIRTTMTFAFIRSEMLAGERTMVVDVTTSSEWLNPSPSIVELDKKAEEFSRTYSPTPSTSTAGPRPPGPIHRLWFSETSSGPIKSQLSDPFYENGTRYYTNTSSVLSSFAAGSRAIPWGEGTPIPPPPVFGSNEAVPAKDFMTIGANIGSYPASTAWNNVNGDPRLGEFHTYRAQHPEEPPAAAEFLPTRDGDSWEFQMGRTFMDDDGTSVLSHSKAIIGPVSNVENRPSTSGVWPFIHPMFTNETSSPLLRLDRAEERYRTLFPDGELMIYWRIGHDDFFEDLLPLTASVILGEALELYAARPVPISPTQAYVVGTGHPVSVDLLDGGLKSINVTHALSVASWPIVPGVPIFDARQGENGSYFVPYGTDELARLVARAQ